MVRILKIGGIAGEFAGRHAGGDRIDHLGVSGPPTGGGDQRTQLVPAPVASVSVGIGATSVRPMLL